MGIRLIQEELCTGCGVCVISCPMDVIKLDEERRKAIVQYIRDCQACYMCERDCPEDIIYVTPDRERRIPLAW